MATQIPGTVIASLATKLDSLDLSEEEHAALAVVLAAGLESGRERRRGGGVHAHRGGADLVGTASARSSAVPSSTEFGFTFQRINVTFNSGGKSAVRRLGVARLSAPRARRAQPPDDAAGEPGQGG